MAKKKIKDMEKIQIYCENTKSYIDVNPGTKLSDLYTSLREEFNQRPLGAFVDNLLKEMSFPIYTSHYIKFIDYSFPDGRRMYSRTLSLLLQKAALELFPQYRLLMSYTLPNGLYGEIREIERGEDGIHKVFPITHKEVNALKDRMREYIQKDLPIIKRKLPKDDAAAIFEANGHHAKASLAKSSKKYFISTYYLEDYADTFYGPLLNSTGEIGVFDLVPFADGFCLQSPSSSNPTRVADYKYQDKLSKVFQEKARWNELIGIDTLPQLNSIISNGDTTSIIHVAEALHERKYADIADMIYSRKDKIKIVLIAGPSSSGKTTTSNRLAIQCRTLGLNPIIVEMDNYFVNREETPIDENGDYDFESLQAMDLGYLNTQLNDLLNGKEIELPKFNFKEGRRYPSGKRIKMTDKDILIMEGIHGLNKNLLKGVDEDKLFRIYASALTSLSIDENNIISTTDCRMLRRMVRDARTRGVSPEETILRWPSVRRGEEKNIFPFQENADIMFNSSLIFELPLLKYYAEPHLNRIPATSPAYSESVRILKFLSHIATPSPEDIVAVPPTSILREFIGGSSIKY